MGTPSYVLRADIAADLKPLLDRLGLTAWEVQAISIAPPWVTIDVAGGRSVKVQVIEPNQLGEVTSRSEARRRMASA